MTSTSGRLRPLLLTLSLSIAGLSACSLIAETSKIQCKVDNDCNSFAPRPLCIDGVCVDTGLGPANCFLGQPAKDEEYLNACSTSSCIPFDNCARIGLCDAGTLPPILAKP